jgi:hypothetical protein
MEDVPLVSPVTVLVENRPDVCKARQGTSRNTWIPKYCVTGKGPWGRMLVSFQSVTEVFISFNAIIVSR